MNTFLKTIAAILAVGLPIAISAESFGVAIPIPFNSATLFGTFVFALTILTMLTDYRTPKPLILAPVCAANTAANRSDLRLAA